MSDQPDYPEHDKLMKIANQSMTIGAFLDWVAWEKDAHLMVYRTDEFEEPCTGTMFTTCLNGHQSGFDIEGTEYEKATLCDACKGTGKVTIKSEGWRHLFSGNPTDLLAEYFDIDQKKIEAEKRQMLESMRS